MRLAEALPKPRPGKVLRRLPSDVAAGKESTGEVTTLEALNVLAALGRGEE